MVKSTMNKSGHKREIHECYRTQPFKINMFTLHVAINEYSLIFPWSQVGEQGGVRSRSSENQ